MKQTFNYATTNEKKLLKYLQAYIEDFFDYDKSEMQEFISELESIRKNIKNDIFRSSFNDTSIERKLIVNKKICSPYDSHFRQVMDTPENVDFLLSQNNFFIYSLQDKKNLTADLKIEKFANQIIAIIEEIGIDYFYDLFVENNLKIISKLLFSSKENMNQILYQYD